MHFLFHILFTTHQRRCTSTVEATDRANESTVTSPDRHRDQSLNTAQMLRMQMAMHPPSTSGADAVADALAARVQQLQQQNQQWLLQQAARQQLQSSTFLRHPYQTPAQLQQQLLLEHHALQQQERLNADASSSSLMLPYVSQYLQQDSARAAAAANSIQQQLQQQRGRYPTALVPPNRPEWMNLRDSSMQLGLPRLDTAYRMLSSSYDPMSFPLPPPTDRNPFASAVAFLDGPRLGLGQQIAGGMGQPPPFTVGPGRAGLSSAVLRQYGIAESNISLSLPVCLSREEDSFKLSSFQVLLRMQIEAFQATEDDVTTHTRGRNKPIGLGQVGIRCLHCAHLPVASRKKGSTYFPAAVLGIYQAAQNMCSTHIQCGLCSEMPEELKREFARLLSSKVASSGAGRPYWAQSAKQLGLVDTEDGGIRFIRSLRPGDRVMFNNDGKVDDDDHH
jgi:hypothetical protein